MRVVDCLEHASLRSAILRKPELFVENDRFGIVRWFGNTQDVIDLFPVSSDKLIDITEFAVLDETSNEQSPQVVAF